MRLFRLLTCFLVFAVHAESAETPMQPSSVASPCDGIPAQTADLRVVKNGKTFDLQTQNKSTREWRRVLSSIEPIELARLSPDEQFLAYVINVRVREQVAPWLYLQKLSTGGREVVSVLKAVPTELCFNADGTVINLVPSSGSPVQQDLAEPMRFLKPTGAKG